MNTFKRTAAFASGFVLAAAAVAGGLTLVRAEDGSANVGSLATITSANLSEWQRAERMPVLPDGPVTEVSPGMLFTLARVSGLSGVTAQLNGTPQKVQQIDGGFVVVIGAIEGEGAAELNLRESFSDGASMSVPFTVFAHAAQPSASTARATSIVPRSTTRVGVNWDQIGVTREGDADYQGPQAIVSLEGGVTALLDNVNSRVLTVDANGEVSTLTDLPTNTFEALVQSPDGKDLVAIDTFTGTAMDVRSGNTQKLSPLLSTMPAGLGLSLGTDGTLYATSPADGTQYSVGQTGTPGLPAETTRRVEVPRAWIDGSTLHVQRNLTEKPLAVEVEPAGGVSILGLDRLSDGRVVVLLDTALKSTVQTQLVVIDGSNVGMVELDGVGAFLVGHPFSVQGTSASYASYDDRGLVITTLYL